jgi:hypothetical protein
MQTCSISAGLPPCATRSALNALTVSWLRPPGHEQQALRAQVMHDGDILMAALGAGLIDTDHLHALHFLLGARHLDIMLDPAPQPLGQHAQQRCGLRHRQGLATRGTSACSQASYRKKSRWRQPRRTRS